MVLKKDQERIKVLLKDTITLLCKNGLTFQNEFSIEATIGITLDQDEVVLVSINEIIQSELNAAKLLAAQQAAEAKKETEDGHSENEGSPSSPSRRHRKRRRSKNTTSNAGSLGNDNDSAEDEDDVSHTSDIEPPVKRLQKDVNIKREGDDEEDNGDDLVFVKQEMDTGDWMQMAGDQGQSMAENEQDSYQTSFSGGSQQDNLDFLQGSSLEPVAAHSGTSNINKMPGRRSATVTSSSAQGAGGGSNSQVSGDNHHNQMNWGSRSFRSRYRVPPAPPSSGKVPSLSSPSNYDPNLWKHSHSAAMDLSTSRNQLARCPHCDRAFGSKHHLNRHIATHSAIKPYQCRECGGKGYSSKEALQRHQRQVHEKNYLYQCRVCGKGFMHKGHFEGHVRSHTGERVTCTRCGASSMDSYFLKQHVCTVEELKV